MHNYGHKQIPSGATWEWKLECPSDLQAPSNQPKFLGLPRGLCTFWLLSGNRKAVTAIAVAFPAALADVALELHA